MHLSHTRLAAAIFALAIPAALSSQATPQVKISYVQDSLPNGLHVIYSVDHSTPVVAVEVMYNVGSKSERAGKTGFAVTPADLTRIGSSYLKPDALTIVAVGDLKTIEAPIRALNLGTVEVWDSEGKKLR